MKNILVRPAIASLGLLTIPFVGMQLTDDWNWTVSDFIIMGALIFGFGLAYEVITKKVAKENKVAVGVLLVIAFLLVWAELAVGVFGTPFAGD